jgi:hypothetical protein
MAENSESGSAEQNSLEQLNDTAATTNSEAAGVKARELLSNNPRFKRAGKSRDGFVIVGQALNAS